jgi:histone-lysine N-methyltransferase EZH2
MNDSNLVLQVYQSVWEEYSQWSSDHNTAALKSLETSHPHLDLQTDWELDPEDNCDNSNDLFTVTEFDTDGFITDEYVLKGNFVILDQPVHPHPPYESCTPISRNLMVGDDPDDLPFIPFADDPTYDYNLVIEEHSYCRWHQPYLDPDSMCGSLTDLFYTEETTLAEVVACATVQTLTMNHGMTAKVIDNTAILPLSHASLINIHKKRYLVYWMSA